MVLFFSFLFTFNESERCFTFYNEPTYEEEKGVLDWEEKKEKKSMTKKKKGEVDVPLIIHNCFFFFICNNDIYYLKNLIKYKNSYLFKVF